MALRLQIVFRVEKVKPEHVVEVHVGLQGEGGGKVVFFDEIGYF